MKVINKPSECTTEEENEGEQQSSDTEQDPNYQSYIGELPYIHIGLLY